MDNLDLPFSAMPGLKDNGYFNWKEKELKKKYLTTSGLVGY
jgi:hypothetical protein